GQLGGPAHVVSAASVCIDNQPRPRGRGGPTASTRGPGGCPGDDDGPRPWWSGPVVAGGSDATVGHVRGPDRALGDRHAGVAGVVHHAVPGVDAHVVRGGPEEDEVT